MEEKKFEKDEFVIKQGEEGNHLYIVEEGTLKCTRKEKLKDPNCEDKFILNYNKGMAFGELAILYNAPRAASIQALTDVILFSLNRETFNHIVKDAVISRREQFKLFFSNINLLDSLTDSEKDKICDCLTIEKYNSGEYVIRQGESGNTFYFIKEGTAIATLRKN